MFHKEIEIFNKRLLVNLQKKFEYDTRVFSRSLPYETKNVYRNLQYKTTTRVFHRSLQQETSMCCKIIDNLFQKNQIEVFIRRLHTIGNRQWRVGPSAPLNPNKWFIIAINYTSVHQHTLAPTANWSFLAFFIKYTSAHCHSLPPSEWLIMLMRYTSAHWRVSTVSTNEWFLIAIPYDAVH